MDNSYEDNVQRKKMHPVLKGFIVLVVLAVAVYFIGAGITGSWLWDMEPEEPVEGENEGFIEGYNYLPRGARYRRKGQRWYSGGYGGYWGGFYRRPWMPWYWRTYYYPRAWRYIAYPSTSAYNVYGTPGLQTYYL